MKKQPDYDPSLHAAVVACALMVAAVIVLASLAGDASKSLEAWVNRYQTLITGFFAIGAAYLTVFQMRVSDQKSDKRHEDLLALSLRPDALRIDRVVRELPAVHERAKYIRLDNPCSGREGDSEEEFWDKAYEFLSVVQNAHSRLHEALAFLSSSKIDEIKPLFDAQLHLIHSKATREVKKTYGELSSLIFQMKCFDKSDRSYNSTAYATQRAILQPTIAAYAPDAGHALATLGEFAEAAEKLKASYTKYIGI